MFRIVPAAADTIRRDAILAFNVTQAQLKTMRGHGFALIDSLPGLAVQQFSVPQGSDASSARQLLAANGIRSGYNYLYRPYQPSTEKPAAAPPRSVPAKASGGCATGRCYGASLIHWHADLSQCARGIRVGVLDTGFDRRHPAFRGRHIKWKTFLPDGEQFAAANWHGTGVLSLLTGSPSSSTPGLIPDAEFLAAGAFYADADGNPVTDTATLVKALGWMAERKAQIVNMSIAGPEDETLHRAIKRYSAAGVVFVAAAGNAGVTAPPSFPAAFPEVIAVTAVDSNLLGYRHANRGSYINLAAPGVDVWTALPGRKAGPQTGTSFAVPYVTAVIAASYPRSELEFRGEALDPKHVVLARLPVRDLGRPGQQVIYGRGLLQAPTASCSRPPPALAKDEWNTTVERTSFNTRS
jgi:hypothetical protein